MNLDFLKLKRQEANKTQAEIAKELGILPQSYFKIESGENNLHPRHWKKLETLLGVTRGELCDFTATVAVERRHKDDDNKAQPPPPPPLDPFLKIVIENWDKLSFEERGRIAGLIRGMGERTPEAVAPVTAICPKCGERITDPIRPGEKFECPKCGQHLRGK